MLPPIQRAVPTMPLVVRNDAFQADLAAQRPPHPFVAPLGHLVSPEAPSGIVRGLSTTIAQRVEAAASPVLGHPAAEPPDGRAREGAVQRLIRWPSRALGLQRMAAEPSEPSEVPGSPEPVQEPYVAAPEPALQPRAELPEPAVQPWSEAPEGEEGQGSFGEDAPAIGSAGGLGAPPVGSGPDRRVVHPAQRMVPSPPPSLERPLLSAPADSAPALRIPSVPVQRRAGDGSPGAPVAPEPDTPAAPAARPGPGAEGGETETGLIGDAEADLAGLPAATSSIGDAAAPVQRRADGDVPPEPAPAGNQSLHLPEHGLQGALLGETGPIGATGSDAFPAPRGDHGVVQRTPDAPEPSHIPAPQLLPNPGASGSPGQLQGASMDAPEAPMLRASLRMGRRLGLGAPLDHGLPRPGVQRSAAPDGRAPIPPGRRDPVQQAASPLGDAVDGGDTFPPAASPVPERSPLADSGDFDAASDRARQPSPGGFAGSEEAGEGAMEPPAAPPETPAQVAAETPAPLIGAEPLVVQAKASTAAGPSAPPSLSGGAASGSAARGEVAEPPAPPSPPSGAGREVAGAGDAVRSPVQTFTGDDAVRSPVQPEAGGAVRSPGEAVGSIVPGPSWQPDASATAAASGPATETTAATALMATAPMTPKLSLISARSTTTASLVRPAGPVRPTLSAQRLATSLQRAPDDGAARGERGPQQPPVSGSAAPSSTPAAVQRADARQPGFALGPLPGAVPGLGRGHAAVPGSATFPETIHSTPGHPGGGSPMSERSPFISRIASSGAEPRLPVVPSTPAPFPSPGDVAVANGIAQRMADGSVVFSPPPPAGYGDVAFSAVPPGPPAAPPVQRVDAPAATPPAAAAPPPGAPGAGASAASSGDLDDLARRLYPKIRPYLKKELWLDRERAGLLMDSGR